MMRKNNALIIYPNPASYHVYIKYASKKDEEVSLTITDLLGRVMMTSVNKMQQGQNLIEWKPEASLPNGLYKITLRTQDHCYSQLTELLR
ncbi:MAG: T9SS type A sorting domain-containing protein [Saprospiraceae bacterium]|nr:T9SS type A sorting domain-containing protein [Saprospiraceae bacterium]